MISRLLSITDSKRRLTPTQVVAVSLGTLLAGYETTSNHMGTASYEVLARPGLAARLRAHPEHAEQIVEELLRFMVVAQNGGMVHVAREDVELADGTLIPAGALVVPVPDAANRDAAVFTDPDEFDADRAASPHLAFGHGLHYCVGADLARLELRVGLQRLVAAFPDLRLAVPDTELPWRTDMLVRGLWRLPVRW